jgi:1-acyl-sn-glycerol-3-phosphate acyltransferase
MVSAIRLFFLFFWTLLLMLIVPLLIPFTFNRQFPLYVARTLFSCGLLKIAGIKLTTNGVENVPKGKPVIFVANHCSHLDIGVLCRIAPVNLHFIGKKELVWIPVVGWYMFIAGHIMIDRSNKRKALESLKKAAIKIKNGKSVAMYPEGTRSKTGEMGKFKKGAFHLAIDAGVSIVPVHIQGTHEIWPSKVNKITPGPVTVQVGKPINSSNYSRKTINAFVAEAKTAIQEMGKE